MTTSIAFVICAIIAASDAAAWDYDTHGPSTWVTDYPLCGGEKQSPIEISVSGVETNYSLGIVDRSIFYTLPTGMTVDNNGHGLQLSITSGAYEIDDASLLPFTAVLAQYHFHWASTSGGVGSEHTLNGIQYFGELHAVHYNKKYGSLSAAVDQSDGLAVFGWFIDIGYPQDNLDFDNFLTIATTGAKYSGNSSVVSTLFSLETFLPPGLDVYYRYSGSLTTPTCDESVTWTVFNEPIKIKSTQASTLANLYFEDTTGTTKLNNNFRPVQSLNGRKITMPPALVKENGASVIRLSILAGLLSYVFLICS